MTTQEILSFLVRDLTTGSPVSVYERYLNGGYMSEKNQHFINYIYAGETDENDKVTKEEESFFDVMLPYFDMAEKDDFVSSEIEFLEKQGLKKWGMEYYGVPMDELPFADRESMLKVTRDTVIVLVAEFQILHDLYLQHPDEVLEALEKGGRNLLDVSDLCRRRNERLIARIERQLALADNPEGVDAVELTFLSLVYAGMEIVILRMKETVRCFNHICREESFGSLRSIYVHPNDGLKNLTLTSARMHSELWGKLPGMQYKFCIQPLTWVSTPDSDERVDFYCTMIYNLVNDSASYFQTRWNLAKTKKIDSPVLYWIDQEGVNKQLVYWSDKQGWLPSERKEFFLNRYFTLCIFSGRLADLARSFDLKEGDFNLLAADAEVSVYEWKTRFFIQIPNCISSAVENHIYEHVVRQYGEALKRFQILKTNHEETN